MCFLQHDVFLGWLIFSLCFIAGTLAAKYFNCVANNYAKLLNNGLYPNAQCLAQALKLSIQREALIIISAEDKPWLNLCIYIFHGVFLAVLFKAYGFGVSFAIVFCVFLALSLLAWIDSKTFLLPDAITQPLLWGGIAYAWYGYGVGLKQSILGTALGYLVPTSIGYVWLLIRRQNGLGAGDAKMLAALGAWLGAYALLLVMLIASLVSVAFAVLHQRSATPSGVYPFGPFISIGAVIILLSHHSTIG